MVQATGVPGTDVDTAEGYRRVTRLSTLALEWLVEKSDPLHPQLFRLQDEYRKLLVDNPDVNYLFCVLDDTRSYRLTGTRGQCAYLGMTFGTPFGQGEVGGRTGTQTQTHIDEYDIGPNGEVDILIAPAADMPDPRPRNSIVLEPGTAQLAIRETHWWKTPDRRRTCAWSWWGKSRHRCSHQMRGPPSSSSPLCSCSSSGNGRPDVARRGDEHEHVRRDDGSEHVAAQRRGAFALKRRDDLPRRPPPVGARSGRR